MSRRLSEFSLDTDEGELKIKIYEVRPRDLYEKMQNCVGKKMFSTEYQELIELCCNLSSEQLGNLYPSEIEVLIKHLKEVNASFLAPWPTIKAVIEKVGLTDWLVKIIEQSKIKEVFSEALIKDWQKLSASSLQKDTQTHGTTAGTSLKRRCDIQKKPNKSK